ncbi:MAG: helix-turn-helix transcriptional regulator [Proteobacteria bacterium]|nr:helix-turn-helix transcriptional regulator [Pseudomonadota bacterium]
MKRKSFNKLYAEAQKRESYWVAEAILDFTDNIYRLMEQKKISKADLAKVLHVSPAYVTKILRGNVNFTLETMVRLARAVGGMLHTHVAPEDTQVGWTYDFKFDQERQVYAPALQVSSQLYEKYWQDPVVSRTTIGAFSKLMLIKSKEPILEEKEIAKTHAAA